MINPGSFWIMIIIPFTWIRRFDLIEAFVGAPKSSIFRGSFHAKKPSIMVLVANSWYEMCELS